MKTSNKLAGNKLAGLTAAAVLALAVAGPVSAGPQPGATDALSAGRPDITPHVASGFLLWKVGSGSSSSVPWGSTTVLDKASQVTATQVGASKSLCRFHGAHRTYNKGPGNATAFHTKAYVNNKEIESHSVPGGLGAKELIDWHGYELDLAEGTNEVIVRYDFFNQVAEVSEKNAYSLRLVVKLDCNGDGKVFGDSGFEILPEASPGRPQGKRPEAKRRSIPLRPRN